MHAKEAETIKNRAQQPFAAPLLFDLRDSASPKRFREMVAPSARRGILRLCAFQISSRPSPLYLRECGVAPSAPPGWADSPGPFIRILKLSRMSTLYKIPARRPSVNDFLSVYNKKTGGRPPLIFTAACRRRREGVRSGETRKAKPLSAASGGRRAGEDAPAMGASIGGNSDEFWISKRGSRGVPRPAQGPAK